MCRHSKSNKIGTRLGYLLGIAQRHQNTSSLDTITFNSGRAINLMRPPVAGARDTIKILTI